MVALFLFGAERVFYVVYCMYASACVVFEVLLSQLPAVPTAQEREVIHKT